MLAGPAIGLHSARQLFWLELFDHSAKTSVDSCCCHSLKDALLLWSAISSRKWIVCITPVAC